MTTRPPQTPVPEDGPPTADGRPPERWPAWTVGGPSAVSISSPEGTHPAQGPAETAAVALRPVHLILALAALGYVGLLALTPVPVVDLWWQMKAGQLILQRGVVPHTDPFSFTAPGAEWVVHEWLPSTCFYWLYTHVSPAALVWYKILGAVLAFGIVMLRCWRRTGRWLLAGLLTAMGALAAHTFLDIRPQILTYVFCAGLLALLEEYRRSTAEEDGATGRGEDEATRIAPSPRLIWAVPPLMLVWANLHAGFMLGFLLLGVYLAAEGLEWARGDGTRRPVVASLAAVIGLSAMLSLLQPNGLALLRYPFMLMGHEVVMGFVQEWLSPNFHNDWVKPYEVLLLLALGGFALARRSIWLGDLVLLLGLAHMSLFSVRQIPIFVLVCVPILAEPLADILRRTEEWLRADGRLGATALLTTALALAIVAFGYALELRDIPRRGWFNYAGMLASFPARACDAIDAHGWDGNLLNDYKWGGYCIWRWYPRRKVFIDGRAEVYFNSSFDDYYAIHNVFPDWPERLRKWRIDTALLDRTSHLARVMEASPEWIRAYADDVAIVFRRRQPFDGSPLVPFGLRTR
jgi:hypothetical protein